MNRDSLLNKTLSPPLSSRVPISHSNGISYSNASLAGGQMNEPSWIPSIRGSTHSVFVLTFLYFVMFISVRRLVAAPFQATLGTIANSFSSRVEILTFFYPCYS